MEVIINQSEFGTPQVSYSHFYSILKSSFGSRISNVYGEDESSIIVVFASDPTAEEEEQLHSLVADLNTPSLPATDPIIQNVLDTTCPVACQARHDTMVTLIASLTSRIEALEALQP